MTRPLRIEYPGAWYHVMNRGLRDITVFPAPGDGARFLNLLAEAVRMFGVECHGYCLMPSEYHLLLRTPRSGLSRFMRHINGVYTQRFNRAHGGDGPVFRGRYRAVLVDPEAYLLQVSRYIHRLPVEAGLTGRPEAYLWSSYRCYVGARRSPPWLEVAPIRARLAASDPALAYRHYTNAGLDARVRAFYRERRAAAILADDDFRERLAAMQARKDVPPARRLTRRPRIEEITEAVRQEYGVSFGQLHRDGRGHPDAEPRAVAMALCRLSGGHPLREIAEAMGGCSAAGVSKAVARLRERMAGDPSLALRVAALQRRLRAG
ncbi:MAG TPA: transposase [Gammaproteobacteria bacterium]|nr:transposase [Gammaproteobacteria bacterium]